jgi:hypothetical protein
MPDAYNNDGWFDDICDGPISATVKLHGSEDPPVSADEAWVIVAPPDFAPAISSVVTLYDLMFDIAVRTGKIPRDDGHYASGHGLARLVSLAEAWRRDNKLSDYRPSYTLDILPILSRAVSMRWVHDPGYSSFHEWIKVGYLDTLGDPDERADVRRGLFDWLRDPNKKDEVRPWLMPRTFADDYAVEPRKGTRYLSLTPTQFALMQRWADGAFEASEKVPETPRAPEITPEGLDRAALENCSGGGFCPGMEVGWLVTKPEAYSEAFRIKRGAKVDSLTVGPGFFSQQIALPWHADFWECQKEEDTEAAGVFQAWWPANRPDDVRLVGRPAGPTVPWNRGVDSKEIMVIEWSKRGFVVSNQYGCFEVDGPPAE